MKTVISFDTEAEAQEFAELLGDIDQLDLERWLAEPQIVAVAHVHFVRRREPLWFMKWARHHCRGGRTRAGRFMDRRGHVDWPELQHPDSDVCSDAWANLRNLSLDQIAERARGQR